MVDTWDYNMEPDDENLPSSAVYAGLKRFGEKIKFYICSFNNTRKQGD